VITSLYILDYPPVISIYLDQLAVECLSFIHMLIVVLLEPYSLDIQSNLIGGFSIIMDTYRTKMISKDLKVSLRDED